MKKIDKKNLENILGGGKWCNFAGGFFTVVGFVNPIVGGVGALASTVYCAYNNV